MQKRKLILCSLLTAVFLLAALAGPASASWRWTSSNPLLFEFDDVNNTGVNLNGAKADWYTYDSTDTWFFDRFGLAPKDVPEEVWRWTASSAAPGTLKVQSIDEPYVPGPYDGNMCYFRLRNVGGFFTYSTTTPDLNLDWANGAVFEVKSKSVGDENSELWPEFYSWGGNTRIGGITFDYTWGSSTTVNTSCSMLFSWRTNDPTNPDDDRISFHNTSEGNRGYEHFGVNYPLGGDPDNPPENVYKLVVKRSPLPVTQHVSTILCNAYVNGVRVIKNQTVTPQWGGLSNTSQLFIGTDYYWGVGMRGEEYDYVKTYEADLVVDTTAPTAPSNLTVANLNAYSFDLHWDESTDADSEVIGYRIYVDGTVRIYNNGDELSRSMHRIPGTAGQVAYNYPVTPNTIYQIDIVAVDYNGNVSAPASVIVTTPADYTGSEIAFQFDDNGNLETTPYSPTNYWDSGASGAVPGRDFWFGKRSTAVGADKDGSIVWDPITCTFRTKFSNADGGSMTLQTVSSGVGAAPGPSGRAIARSSDMNSWFRWIKDGDYIKGVSAEFDVDIVGDANGWCAAWDTFPAVGECPWTSDLGHEGSDWGSQWSNRGTAYMNVGSNLILGEPGYEPEGCYVWVDPNPVLATDPEWLQWNNVSTGSGQYMIQARVASTKPVDTKWFDVYIGTENIGQIKLPNTGSDHIWQTVDGPTATLSAGSHNIKTVFVTDRYNLSWIQLVPLAGGTPIRLRAADFDAANEVTAGKACAGECPPSPVNGEVDICYSYGGSPSNSGNGAQLFVMAQSGNIRDPLDDRIRLSSSAGSDILTLSFADGLGWGLTPEDGTASGCKDQYGNPYPRDGVIQGKCNNIKIKLAAVSAGGNDEYWDIWVTRPNGDTFHVNPAFCNYVSGSASAVFGVDGHTVKLSSASELSGNRVELGMRDQGNIFGTKYNSVVLRNDWDGDVTVKVSTLAQLQKLGLGTRVTWDATGGEKIVTIDPTTVDYVDFFFYVEEEDRSSAIRVVDAPFAPSVSKGQQVTSINGVLKRDANGNRYIDISDGSVVTDTATKTIDPVGMTNLTVGGSAVTGGVGTANTGLLATVWGEVSDVNYDEFGNIHYKLDDGSGTKIHVWDLAYDGNMQFPVQGEYWTAIGPIVLESDGAEGFLRALVADSVNKIR